MSPFFEKSVKLILNRVLKKVLDRILRRDASGDDKKDSQAGHEVPRVSNKNHPWRLCPAGESWVTTHPLTVPASNSGPKRKTIRDGHCRINPGKLEVYTAEELIEIAAQNFDTLLDDPSVMPVPDALGFPDGNQYDRLIAGWTKFWNEILKPEDPVTPDFIKALIATESSFLLPKDQNSKDLNK